MGLILSNMSTYKIIKIDKELGHVTVVYSVDGIEQTMGDCHLDSEESTKAFLEDYGNRYEAAITADKAAAVVPKEVMDMVGKTLEVPEVKIDSNPIAADVMAVN